MDTKEYIKIRGASEHNLKKINLDIPHRQITVITGPSGSGKSSLAFDTIYAEGQRRYVESLSSYARQFLDNIQKPEVESITGLSPSISIDQSSVSNNPRSTVGTVTEIYDFMRLLWSKASTPICEHCGKEVEQQSIDQIVDTIMSYEEGTKIIIYSPIVRDRKGEHKQEIEKYKRKGYSRFRVDGELLEISSEVFIDKNLRHNIEIVIDRVVVKKEERFRIREAIDTAIMFSDGLAIVGFHEKKSSDILFNQKYACVDCGVSFPEPEPRLFSFNSPMGACGKCDGLGYLNPEHVIAENIKNDDEIKNDHQSNPICPSCKGIKLKSESLIYKINKKNIAEVSDLAIDKALDFFENVKLDNFRAKISEKVLKEIVSRIKFLSSVGLSYLSLNRPVTTLSGGELQRARLATQLGSSLIGITYILDEPSIGLHPSDHHKLLGNIVELKNRGNTVIVVEHDKTTMEYADHIIDIGPGAGIHGGHIVAEGTIDEIKNNTKSITGLYLSEKKKLSDRERKAIGEFLEIQGATGNNLKNVSLKIPLGCLVGITGVSGSGKSSLVLDTLYPAIMKKLYPVYTGEPLPFSKMLVSGENIETKKTGRFGKRGEIGQVGKIDKVLCIDQSPIGRTPRSNPATYVGIYNDIRNVFAELPESKIRGYKPGRFSFNVGGGRCENCSGDGSVKIEMHFLPDVFVQCEACGGKRFNPETLQIRFKGKNISDVLNMTVEEALTFFENNSKLKRVLSILNDVGLHYIHLGQPSNTLSGGESQRIKLASELGKKSTGNTVFILDEPTTGLHFDDINKLLLLLDRLSKEGNTVIVVEHNMELISKMDYVVDLGPSGGEKGGRIVAEGTPDKISKFSESLTGKFLENFFVK